MCCSHGESDPCHVRSFHDANNMKKSCVWKLFTFITDNYDPSVCNRTEQGIHPTWSSHKFVYSQNLWMLNRPEKIRLSIEQQLNK